MENNKDFLTVGYEEKKRIFDFSMEANLDESDERVVVLGSYSRFPGRYVVGKKEEDGKFVRLTRDNKPISVMESIVYGLLDVLEVKGLNNNPSDKYNYHTENATYSMINKINNLDQSLLDSLTDVPENIFGTGRYVSKRQLEQLDNSLMFIKVTDFTVYFKVIDKDGYRLLGKFEYNDKLYKDIPIIDYSFEKGLEKFSYPYKEEYREVYLTISLGEFIRGYAYKYIVGIIIPQE